MSDPTETTPKPSPFAEMHRLVKAATAEGASEEEKCAPTIFLDACLARANRNRSKALN